MASARAPGIYRLYLESPRGTRKLSKAANAAYWNVSNLGSADGTISTSATPDTWNFLPLSSDAGSAGYKIVLTYEASTATTLDASDCVGIIPVVVDGEAQTIGIAGGGGGGLGNANFTADLSAGDNAYVASVETPVMVVRAVQGVQSFRVGGDKVFLSLEDSTA